MSHPVSNKPVDAYGGHEEPTNDLCRSKKLDSSVHSKAATLPTFVIRIEVHVRRDP